MKIANSTVAFASEHKESSYYYRTTVTMEAASSKNTAAAILSLSQESGASMTDALQTYEKQQKEEAEKQRQQNMLKSLKEMSLRMKAEESNTYEVPDDVDNKIKMLRRILAALRGEKLPKEELEDMVRKTKTADLRSQSFRNMDCSNQVTALNINVGTTGSGTVWQKVTAGSGYYEEAEYTSFASIGKVLTEDGRSIDFNISLSMSRAFMEEYDYLEVAEYIKTDPLMINLDTDIGTVSDVKFFFDLDADGKQEEISFAGAGSGFLALDKNGDGVINDGSELFGTKSGDGFADLAAYDEDGNGWIDENDSIYSHLKVWTKDAEGNDYLMDLKKADVGAIYLSAADTVFSLKDADNSMNGQIQKTGIYLHEKTGQVGTLNHVDLVV